MKKILVTLLLLVAGSGLASAQDTPAARGQGWLLSGIGSAIRQGASPFVQLNAGGEVRLPYGLGLGSEVGYLTAARDLGNGVGQFTAGGFYHFPTSRKVIPFVSAGYAALTNDGTVNGMYFGGGADYWFHDRLGLRFEIRDHVITSHSPLHLVGFRIGLSFR